MFDKFIWTGFQRGSGKYTFFELSQTSAILQKYCQIPGGTTTLYEIFADKSVLATCLKKLLWYPIRYRDILTGWQWLRTKEELTIDTKTWFFMSRIPQESLGKKATNHHACHIRQSYFQVITASADNPLLWLIKFAQWILIVGVRNLYEKIYYQHLKLKSQCFVKESISRPQYAGGCRNAFGLKMADYAPTTVLISMITPENGAL